MPRLRLWTGLDGWRAEVASMDLGPEGVSASGTQLGIDPVPYRLDYSLAAGDNFITRSLKVEATGEGWTRRLQLVRDREGAWRSEAADEGPSNSLPQGEPSKPSQAPWDCDLGFRR